METFDIQSDKLDLKIAIVEVESIHMHEETILELVQKLAADLLKDGIMRHPIIVDQETIVVLDGMHRAAASRMIGCVRIPVCFVDYENLWIRVESWYRTFSKAAGQDLINELIRWNIKTRRSSIEEARKNLEKGTAAAFIATNRECLIIRNTSNDVLQNFRLVASIERMAKGLGYLIGYETEKDALNQLEAELTSAILGPPPITKVDVRRSGLRNDLFPHKATRHIIPARPLGINVPIEILQDRRMGLQQANKQLIEMLTRRPVKRLDPGSLIENRRYEEQIFLFT